MFAVFRSAHASGLRLNEDTVSREFLTSPERRMSPLFFVPFVSFCSMGLRPAAALDYSGNFKIARMAKPGHG